VSGRARRRVSYPETGSSRTRKSDNRKQGAPSKRSRSQRSRAAHLRARGLPTTDHARGFGAELSGRASACCQIEVRASKWLQRSVNAASLRWKRARAPPALRCIERSSGQILQASETESTSSRLGRVVHIANGNRSTHFSFAIIASPIRMNARPISARPMLCASRARPPAAEHSSARISAAPNSDGPRTFG